MTADAPSGAGTTGVPPELAASRAAQAEEPGRITLIDLDPDDGSLEGTQVALDPEGASASAVPVTTAGGEDSVRAALASGEPEVAVRGGRLFASRMTHVESPVPNGEAFPALRAGGKDADNSAGP